MKIENAVMALDQLQILTEEDGLIWNAIPNADRPPYSSRNNPTILSSTVWRWAVFYLENRFTEQSRNIVYDLAYRLGSELREVELRPDQVLSEIQLMAGKPVEGQDPFYLRTYAPAETLPQRERLAENAIRDIVDTAVDHLGDRRHSRYGTPSYKRDRAMLELDIELKTNPHLRRVLPFVPVPLNLVACTFFDINGAAAFALREYYKKNPNDRAAQLTTQSA